MELLAGLKMTLVDADLNDLNLKFQEVLPTQMKDMGHCLKSL